VLTHGFFERRFASDPGIVGQAVSVDGRPTTVVGVLGPSFDFTEIFAPGRRIDYVAPFPLSERSNRTGNTLGLIGRLAPGATLEAASDEATALATSTQGERLNGFDPFLRPLHEHVSGGFRPAIGVLIGAVALVMLTVCANLSNLLLARGVTRDREMAIRAAIGAPRRRLIRQMLTESLLLSGVGSALGIVVAYFGTAFLASLDLRIPLLGQARVDGPAIVVAIASAFAVGVVFGVAPALRGTDIRLHESLKDSTRGSSEGRRQGALRGALVVSEVALACILMIVSTLMARSFGEVLDVDLGYRAERAVAIRIDPSTRWPSDEAHVAYYSEVLERLRAAPGVVAAGLSDVLPMGFNRSWNLRDTALPPERVVYPYVRVVSDGYVDAMGLSLVAGRDLAPEDTRGVPAVALVNQALVDLLWPDVNPLGRTVRASGGDYTVIGVVRDTRQLSVEQAPGPEVFFSIRQLRDHSAMHLILRGDRALEDLVAAARAELRAIDPTLPLDQVIPIQDIVDASIAPRRFLVGLLSAFAAFALVLASLGVYGVISYSVTQRRREIGIHIALGASSGDVQGRIVRSTLLLVGVGLGVGLLLAAVGGRLLESLLFGVTPLDPATYLLVVAMLGGVAGVAGYLPARRAARANPLEALGGEGVG
jgi:predicted permease